jgi:hypothetical protein
MSSYLFPYFILLNYVQRKEHNVFKHIYMILHSIRINYQIIIIYFATENPKLRTMCE